MHPAAGFVVPPTGFAVFVETSRNAETHATVQKVRLLCIEQDKMDGMPQ